MLALWRGMSKPSVLEHVDKPIDWWGFWSILEQLLCYFMIPEHDESPLWLMLVASESILIVH
jgi:hypothetical protein